MAIVLDGTTGITTPGLTNTGTETIVNLTSTGNTTLGDATTDTLTVGVTGIVKDSSGNVGIGTASPATRLHTYTSSGGNKLTVEAGAASQQAVVSLVTNATTPGQCQLYMGKSGATTNGQVGYDPNSDYMYFYTSNSERMRIDSSGIVVMGTTDTTNTSRLKLSSTPTSNRAVSAQLTVQRVDPATQYEGVCFNTGSARAAYILRIPGSDALTFGFDAGSSTSEAMRIDTSGNLLINTTSAYGGTLFKLEVNSTNYCMGINATAGGTTDMIDFYSSGTFAGKISSNGATTAYNTSSDYRLKEDVQPMTGALAKVSALKPVTFKWISDGNEGEGFIAHELAEVCPYAVNGEKDEVDAEGNIRAQSIDTSFLIATLTAAIQEQQALITALTARITALETP